MASRPPYPPSLTVKSWEKAKGLIARISGVKTGITELLVKAEKEFNSAPWDAAQSIQDLAAMQQRGMAALKQFQSEHYKKYQPFFRKLQSTYADLSSELKKKAVNFEADPKLAKFAPVLKKMAEDANKFTYAVAWGTVSVPFQTEFLEDLKKLEEQGKVALKWLSQIIPALEKVEKKLGEFKNSPPTVKAYDGLVPQYFRLPGTYIKEAGKAVPELLEKCAQFLAYANKNWKGNTPENTDMKKRVAADLEELKKCKNLVENIARNY